MHTMDTRPCRVCGWPAQDNSDHCEDHVREPWLPPMDFVALGNDPENWRDDR